MAFWCPNFLSYWGLFDRLTDQITGDIQLQLPTSDVEHYFVGSG